MLCAELLPNAYRQLGLAIGHVFGFTSALLSTLAFPLLNEAVGAAPQLLASAAVVLACTLYVRHRLPETKGIDLD